MFFPNLCSLSWLALQLQRRVMQRYDMLHNRPPQTGSAGLRGAALVYPVDTRK